MGITTTRHRDTEQAGQRLKGAKGMQMGICAQAVRLIRIGQAEDGEGYGGLTPPPIYPALGSLELLPAQDTNR